MIIISGGALEEKVVFDTLHEFSQRCIIAVDHGLQFVYEHQIKPDYIVGDFDSILEEVIRYYREETDIPIREYNPIKDASDTEMAVRLALTLGCANMILLGATGGRLDHFWANVQTLEIARKAGIPAEIRDSQNRVRLIDGATKLVKGEVFGDYFSIFPLGGEVEGLTISGAKYPLCDHTVKPCDSLCVSNQIEGEEVQIRFQEGVIVLMLTKDQEKQK